MSSETKTDVVWAGPNHSEPDLHKTRRAEDGIRTRDLNLGKVALYQLSYFRIRARGADGPKCSWSPEGCDYGQCQDQDNPVELSARRPEATTVSLSAVQLIDHHYLGQRHRCDHELGNTISSLDLEAFIAVIHHDHLDLAPVPGVDETGGIHHANAVTSRQAAPRHDQPGVHLWYGDRHPGGDDCPLPRFENGRMAGVEIDTSVTMVGAVGRG